MASAAESIERVDREIANLNERIRVLEQNMSAMKEFIKEALVPAISTLEQNTSAMKESIKEAVVQGNWPVGNSNMESKPEEMGETGREEGGIKILKIDDFNNRFMRVEYRDHAHKLAHQFRFLGKIESRDVIVFVGLSATHNFISKELVNALGIPLTRTESKFRVSFRYRTGSKGDEVCEGVVLKTQGIEIVETFFVTDYLAIADVVLGNQWLTTLDDTSLQGMPKNLTFKRNGKAVTLRADPSLPRIDAIGFMRLGWILE